MRKVNTALLILGALTTFAPFTAWSKKLPKKLKIEYTIIEKARLCDNCSGRGIVAKKGIELAEFGEESSGASESCSKCSGNKYLTASKAGVDYYTKTVAIASFSPEAKRQKLFASKKYRRHFLNKYFFADYVLVVTKDTQDSDIAQLPVALKKLHYLTLQLESIKKAVIDRENGETKFEYIYEPPEKNNKSNNVKKAPAKASNDEFDDIEEDGDESEAAVVLEEEDDEPALLYIAFRSDTIKKKTLKSTEQQIIDLKKKYHLLYD